MSKIQVDSIVNKDDTGSPTFPKGATVTGVITATSFTGDVNGDAQGLSGTPNIVVGVTTASTVSASSSITVGDTFLQANAVGLGTTTTAGRNGIGNTTVGTLVYNAETQQVEVYDGNAWIGGLRTQLLATGGTKSTTSRSGYAVHTFTSPGTLEVTQGSVTAEYLVIAGGAGGGTHPGGSTGGGGGAGALRFSDSFPIGVGNYTVQVGGGGAAGNEEGGAGTPSFITNPGITSITAAGGGGGGGGGTSGTPQRNGRDGGSGGGAAEGPSPGGTGSGDTGGTADSNSPANGWGNDGGGGGANSAGGGGGASAVGGSGNPPNYKGGDGGAGLAYSINGTSTTRAGGGGGSGNNPGAGGAGGSGGGGTGGTYPGQGTAGTTNTGGGGGGSAYTPTGVAGGSGIVIIAYPTS